MKTLLASTLAALTAAIVGVLGVAPAAHADVDWCHVDAGSLNVTAQNRGTAWGPIPLWTVSVGALNMSIDVNANTESEALAAGVSAASGEAAARCAQQAPPAPVAPAVTTDAATTTVDVGTDPLPVTTTPTVDPADAQASALAGAADVTLVGTGWGPEPLWRVWVPALNTTIDVNAPDADTARARATGAIRQQIDASPAAAAAAAAATSATASLAPSAAPDASTADTAGVVAAPTVAARQAATAPTVAAPKPVTVIASTPVVKPQASLAKVLSQSLGAVHRGTVVKITPDTVCAVGTSRIPCRQLAPAVLSNDEHTVRVAGTKTGATIVARRVTVTA